MTHASVTIQITPESKPAIPSWMGDEVLATALLDRLLHHAEVMAINGPSYRMKDRLAGLSDQAEPAQPGTGGKSTGVGLSGEKSHRR